MGQKNDFHVTSDKSNLLRLPIERGIIPLRLRWLVLRSLSFLFLDQQSHKAHCYKGINILDIFLASLWRNPQIAINGHEQNFILSNLMACSHYQILNLAEWNVIRILNVWIRFLKTKLIK